MAMESLRPNRSLLNAKFDGYKLSPEPLEVQTTYLAAAVNVVSLKDDVFSHLHVRAFGWTNHLVLDNWNEEDNQSLLYFVDENYSINQVTIKVNIDIELRLLEEFWIRVKINHNDTTFSMLI